MTRPSIRVVDLAEVQSVVDHALAYRAVLAAFEAIAGGAVEAPDELALRLSTRGEVHIKGGWLTGQRWLVFKVATGSFPVAGNGGCSLLVDSRTGVVGALIDDGGWLTEMRTAAAGALAADLLAVDGPLAVAVIGTGVQARFQLAALRARREVRSVRVWGRTADRAATFATEVDATVCNSIDDAVHDADVIVTTTSSSTPVLSAAHLRPGVHVTAMGADMVGKRELASGVFERATVVAVDDRATARRVGELQHAPPEVVDRAVPLAQVLLARLRGDFVRTRDDITVVDLCGVGACDAAIAGLAADALGL
jgi:ornithine cyclodeaminase